MELTLQPNKLYQAEQVVSVDNNILTLIGENGCGKSAILESVFEQYLENNNVNLICFSSGQNESFSELYSKYINTSRKVKFEARADKLKIDFINSFYFDYNWSKILIFFATALKKEGNTRKFLKDKYIEVNEFNDDISTQLNFNLKVEKIYIDRINDSLEIEAITPDEPTLRRTEFHNILSRVIEKKVNSDFDFSERLAKTKIQIKANEVVDVFQRDIEKIFTFFSAATSDDYFISLFETELQLSRDLKLRDLSDGEYQLLSLYAIVDLFDSDKTFFLLDEIDTHVHYSLIKKVWTLLKSVKGNILSSTHILDSVLNNEFSSIRYVKDGSVSDNYILAEIITRIEDLSARKEFQFAIAAKAENIVLIDNINDWKAFISFLEIKKPDFDRDKLLNIEVINVSSGRDNDLEELGNNKRIWVEEFHYSNAPKDIKTKNIFMICDRDDSNPNYNQANPIKVNGYTKPRGLQPNVHLLAWSRREIENYFISHTMLSEYSLVEQINAELIPREQLQAGNNMDFQSVKTANVKDIIKVLFCDENGLDIEKRKEVISKIPANEISDDILNLYNYLNDKIN
ncbi:AAA family ATPase [Draconibacterium orientale]|uniref:AAA family ATPase n=1 Tax=Draconibacterium orientale TaxID=1168034 RepID=UPI0029BFE7F2|nr:AAA family ATPase [Draconibacterium orientale]